MSRHFEQVKNYFDRGFWDTFKVRNAVIKNWITAEEFEIITGRPFER